MGPRTILYTGKGGVGKTSVAAATARRIAAGGARTLVVSTDPAHSLADVLDVEVGRRPTEVGDGLFAQQVQAQSELERNWAGVQGWLGALLAERGVDRIAADELSVPPGGDELFSLLELKRHWESGEWDALVVDCAPTGETLRLLSFPDVARWWLEKVFGRETQLLAAARPLARAFLDVSLPDERVFMEVQELIRNLVAMDAILRDASRTTLRLVMTPDRVVVKEAMRTFTYLNLFGYLTDAVVVNRVFPDAVDGTYFGAWRALQQEQLALVEPGFAPVPVLCAPYFEREVQGAGMLDRLAEELFESAAPADVLHASVTRELRQEGDGAVLRLELPFAAKGDVSLKKAGLELIVRVGDAKRVIELPASMTGMRPASATFADGGLEVRFTPAPAPEAEAVASRG
jgi:arsenite-transporting ATPase